MLKKYYVYIMTNSTHRVLYTGVTNNIERRVFEHRNGLASQFTSKYNVDKVVFCEEFTSPIEAISAEKKIKAGSRKKKIALIESNNPDWVELVSSEIASLRSQ